MALSPMPTDRRPLCPQPEGYTRLHLACGIRAHKHRVYKRTIRETQVQKLLISIEKPAVNQVLPMNVSLREQRVVAQQASEHQGY